MWDVIDTVTGIAMPVLLIYYVYRTRKLEKQLEAAVQRLFDETVDRMNGDA